LCRKETTKRNSKQEQETAEATNANQVSSVGTELDKDKYLQRLSNFEKEETSRIELLRKGTDGLTY